MAQPLRSPERVGVPVPDPGSPVEPGSPFLPSRALHAKLPVQSLPFVRAPPLGGQLEYWHFPGVLASLTQGQLAASSFPCKSNTLHPTPAPTNPCHLPQFLPLGKCLSQWHTVSLHEELMHVQTPGGERPPAASLLGGDPGSLTLNSGEGGKSHTEQQHQVSTSLPEASPELPLVTSFLALSESTLWNYTQ